MRRRKALWLGAGVAAGALALAGAVAAGGGAQPAAGDAAETAAADEPRQTMGEIFESLRVVLPYSLDRDRFEDPANREAIGQQLAQLARNAERLEAHGRGRDESFFFLSRSLAWDLREARRRFAEGDFRHARFVVQEVVDTCVACHSRLHSDRDSPLAERFMEEEAIASLSAEERAKLRLATRQFGLALDSYEAVLRSDDASPDFLDLMGHLDDYLELAIRVKADPARPIPVLEAFQRRPDVSKALAENLDSWLADLRALRDAPPSGTPLEVARSLLSAAEDRERYAFDRMALVPYIAASSALLGWVTDHANEGREAAEAYYLLGLADSRIGRSAHHAQTEFYLVTAIRMDPSSDTAEKAYGLLEEIVVSGFSGSSGVNVPPDMQGLLDELRRLIDTSRSRAGAPRHAAPPAGSARGQPTAAEPGSRTAPPPS